MKECITALLVMISMTLMGQKIEIFEGSSNQRSAEVKTEKMIRFTSDTTDVYTIKVIGPGGIKMTTPVKKAEILSQSIKEFSLDTRYWRRGTYFIIAENKFSIKILINF